MILYRSEVSYFLIIPLIFLFSCKKDEVIVKPTENPKGNALLHIHFIHMADSFPLISGQTYTLPSNETFSVNVFKYYISNVEIVFTDGSVFRENYSYHLMDFQGKNKLVLNHLPAKSISKLRFMIGVDSLHNVSGPQTGDLSPSLGMFWTWNTGYIMVKFEGYSPQSGASDKSINLHIGGFKGANKTQRNVTLSLPPGITLTENKTSEINLVTNVSKMFYGVHSISFSTHYITMINNKNAAEIADNYAQMISFKNFIP